MTTTTFSYRNLNIKPFLGIFIVTSAARSIIYTMIYLALTSLLLHYLPVTSIVPADKLITQELSFNAAPSTAAL